MSDVFFIKCDQFLKAEEYKRIEYEIKRRVGNASVVLLRPGMELVYPTQRWIPVTERLPENDEKVLCCTMTKKGLPNIVIGYHYENGWACGMNNNVVAWMPLPEPWKGET